MCAVLAVVAVIVMGWVGLAAWVARFLFSGFPFDHVERYFVVQVVVTAVGLIIWPSTRSRLSVSEESVKFSHSKVLGLLVTKDFRANMRDIVKVTYLSTDGELVFLQTSGAHQSVPLRGMKNTDIERVLGLLGNCCELVVKPVGHVHGKEIKTPPPPPTSSAPPAQASSEGRQP